MRLVESKAALFLLSFALFGLLFVLDILQWYAYSAGRDEAFDWPMSLSYAGPYFFWIWVLSPGAYLAFRWSQPFSLGKKIAVHFPLSLLFGLLVLSLNLASTILIRQELEIGEVSALGFGERLLKSIQMSYSFLFNGFMIYWFMQIALSALDFYRRYRDQQMRAVALESQLSQAELRTLKRQLQPHFLFNALNTIAMMVRRKKDEEAVDMISALSDLLRSSLKKQSEQMVPLSEEIDLLKKYLQIEQLRFKDKLTLNFQLQAESLKIPVPNLILQPIVENAFKYGVSQRMEEAGISISSSLSDDFLHLLVVNLGPPLPEGWSLEKNKGIGLSNTLARLEQIYGKDFHFSIKSIQDTGVAVEIRIKRKT